MASLTRNTAFAFLMALEEDLIQALTELGPAATPLTEGETAQATSRRAADLGGDAAPGIWTDLLYYLDLGQKLDVVRRAEHDLARQLAIDVADLRNLDSLLRPLVTIRNRVCHARPMDEDDLPRVIDVARGAIDGRLPFRVLLTFPWVA